MCVCGRFYVAETVLALEYLHMMGVVYRDLKPENVLVRGDGHIMLSDFDLSLKCDVVPRLLRPAKGAGGGAGGETISYMNTPSVRRSPALPWPWPEVISGQGHGSAADWRTLGVFMYEMLYGRTPFKGESNEKTLINIIKQPVTFPRLAAGAAAGATAASGREWEELRAAQDLMTQLLAKNPKKRLGSTMGSAEVKRHPFFKGVNWALVRSIRPPEVPPKPKPAPAPVPKKVVMMSKKERQEPYSYRPDDHFEYF
uniref:non-specific serine/threonine protein kinase n=1 Tax=Oryza brachyantha TaxID=4533 RepID=J3KWV9_ORYBR